jgi:hypothetical protein
VRPLSELWPKGSAPLAIRCLLGLTQLMGKGLVSGGMRTAWNEPRELGLILGEHEG